MSSSVCVRLTYPGTVAGILDGVDNAELVQHFTHDDDAHPDGGQTGSHGPEGAVGHGQRPQDHQDQVHQRWLQTATIGHTRAALEVGELRPGGHMRSH